MYKWIQSDPVQIHSMLNATRRHDVNKILFAVQRASLIIRNHEIARNRLTYMEAPFARFLGYNQIRI